VSLYACHRYRDLIIAHMNQQTNDDWSGAKEVFAPMPERDCDGEGCEDKFRPKGPWGERRCGRCRAEKRPYKEPF